MAHEMAMHALGHEKMKKEMAKHLKEMHIKELHDGTHHVTRHDGKGGMHESNAPTVDHIHDAIEQHFGTPNQGEEEMQHPEPDGDEVAPPMMG